MKSFSGILAIITLCSVAFTGCENVPEGPRTVPASGVVTLNGEPVEGAAIVFIGDSGEFSAHGMSDSQGQFSLDAFEYKTGAVPGGYKVVVTKTVEITDESGAKLTGEGALHAGEGSQLGIRNDLPSKYQNPNNGLSFIIPDDGTSDLQVELVASK